MKIKILYSHLNTGPESDFKARPSYFNFGSCFMNLLSTVHNQDDIQLYVIYDKTRGEIEQNWINKYRNIQSITFYEIEGGTMWDAAKEMYRIARELSVNMEDNDLFYFLENDYLHIKGWVEKIKDLFKTFNGLNYVSLYDHFDKYTHPMYEDLVSKIFVSNTHHWRTVPSTCGSYLVNKKTFLEDYNILTNIEGDHNKWLYLAEQKDRFVLSPIPSLSTHCMEGLLAPTIDWKRINN